MSVSVCVCEGVYVVEYLGTCCWVDICGFGCVCVYVCSFLSVCLSVCARVCLCVTLTSF